MGCGGSKGGKGKVDLKIEKTKIPEFDELFDQAAEPLETIAGINKSVHAAMNKFMKACHVMIIKDHTVKDAVLVMLTCFSVSCNGDFSKISPKLDLEPPFITIEIEKLDKFCHAALEAFGELVEAVGGVAEKCEPLVEQIKGLAEQCAEFPGKATEAVQGANLGLMDGAKAIKATGSNVVKLGKAPTILGDLLKTAGEAITAFTDAVKLAGNVDELEKIHAIGKKAAAEKVKSVDKLVIGYFPEQERIDKSKIGKK